MFLDTLWVDERYRHHGIGSMIIHEVQNMNIVLGIDETMGLL